MVLQIFSFYLSGLWYCAGKSIVSVDPSVYSNLFYTIQRMYDKLNKVFQVLYEQIFT
jgi:hypothetical protein